MLGGGSSLNFSLPCESNRPVRRRVGGALLGGLWGVDLDFLGCSLLKTNIKPWADLCRFSSTYVHNIAVDLKEHGKMLACLSHFQPI